MSRKPPHYPDEMAPDPARSYERARPEAESGMGRLDADPVTPVSRPDQMEKAVGNRQASRQINADDVTNASNGPLPDSPTPVFHPPRKPKRLLKKSNRPGSHYRR
jgi:hypothetical protein